MFPPQGIAAPPPEPWTIADWYGSGLAGGGRDGILIPDFIGSDFKLTGEVMFVACAEGYSSYFDLTGRLENCKHHERPLDFYGGEIDYDANAIKIRKHVHDAYTEIAKANFTVELLTWYSFVYEVAGTSLYYKANDTSISGTDTDLTASTPVGFFLRKGGGCYVGRNMKVTAPSSPPNPSIIKPKCFLSEIVGKGTDDDPIRSGIADNSLVSAYTAIIPTNPETGRIAELGLFLCIVEEKNSDIEEIKAMSCVREISRARFKEEVRKLEEDLKLKRKHNIQHILREI